MEGDPYLLPNKTLRNKFDVTDRDELQKLEADSVALRQAVLMSKRISPPYSFDTLKYIHGFLFGGVYDWAGAPRICNLAKYQFDNDKNEPIYFTNYKAIELMADLIFNDLNKKKFLCGLQKGEFSDQLAELFVVLNNLHPFREGNGRTQRLFLAKVAENAGYQIAFDVVTRERMISVSIAGSLGDVAPAKRLFEEMLDADRVNALRTAMRALRLHYKDGDWQDIYISTTVSGRAYNGILAGTAGSEFMMQVKDERDWIAIGNVADLPEGAESGDSVSIEATKWKM